MPREDELEGEDKDPSKAVDAYMKLLIREGDEPRISTREKFEGWYTGLRKGFTVAHRSSGGDGNIDFILESGKTAILIQMKYTEQVDKDQIKAFNYTMKKWEDRNSFDGWVDSDVTDELNKRHYKEAFARIQDNGKEVVWEFVCNRKLDTPTYEKYSKILNSQVPHGFQTRLITANMLKYFTMLERVGAGPTEPLEVKIVSNTFTSHQESIGGIKVTTYLCVMYLDDLVKNLKSKPDPHSFFDRNVRLHQLSSTVNGNILDTFKNEHPSFFLDNNGISILCTNAYYTNIDNTTDRVHIELPGIINGGQTINTLMTLAESELMPAKILARITQISAEDQMKPGSKDLINRMIFRSNSNNTMYPWDLRSNDEVQVDIAKEFFDRKIFYERKANEYRQTQPSMKASIDSIRLAQNAVICSDDIDGSGKGGPAYLKSIGKEPLFTKTKHFESLYERIFSGTLDYNLLEKQTVLYLGLDKALGSIRRIVGIPGKYARFKGAAENFVLGIWWRAIENHDSIGHLVFYDKKRGSLKEVASKMIKEMYHLFINDLRTRNQNDIFRDEDCWRRAKETFLTEDWKSKVSEAVKADLLEDDR